MKKNILVVCDDNTLYSKIAEAYFRKYAGHWKNIFSAGISIKGKRISPDLMPLLEKEDLPLIESNLMSIENYSSINIDYVIALTKEAYNYCMKNEIGKEATLFPIEINSSDSIEKKSDEIKSKVLQFVKNGPIKRWLEQ
jgi:protein-tyrosine-phosphatase